MADVKIAGETFHVLVEGPERAPVIMLSNSLGTNLHLWDGQVAALTKHFKVVRYDSRGHGKSPVSGGAFSIAGLGRDAIAIMDALHLDRVHWMGLSMGGMVGQWLLVNARERIGRAILANTAAQLGPPDMWNTRIRKVLSQGMGSIIPAVIDRWFTAAFQAAAPAEVARVVAMLQDTPVHGYAGSCSAIRDMDQRETIRSVSNPVLVIVGKQDPATVPEAGALIQSAIRDARLVALDAAHLSNIEAEAEFNKVMMAFMTDKTLRFAPPVAAPVRKKLAKVMNGKAATGKKVAGKVVQGKAVQGKAAKGKAAQGKAVQGKAAQGKAAQGKAVQGKAAQGRAVQGKAGSGKAVPGKTAKAKAGTAKAGAAKTISGKTAAGKASIGKTSARKVVTRKAAAGKTPTRTVAAPRKAAKPGAARKVTKPAVQPVAPQKIAGKMAAKKKAVAKKPVTRRKD